MKQILASKVPLHYVILLVITVQVSLRNPEASIDKSLLMSSFNLHLTYPPPQLSHHFQVLVLCKLGQIQALSFSFLFCIIRITFPRWKITGSVEQL